MGRPKLQDAASGKTALYPLVLLLLTIFSVNFVSMPKIEYIGDPMMMRFAAERLITQRTISIPAEIAASTGEKGQFFYFNEKKNTWYCKYPIFNSLIYVPPLVAEKWLSRNHPFNTASSLRVLVLNVYNLILSVLIGLYLYAIVSFYTSRVVVKWLFILAVLYSTFFWNYLRAQSAEIYQALFFLGFYYHFTKFRKQSSRLPASPTGNPFKSLSIAALFLSLLCLTKFVYLLMVPIAGIALLLAGYTPGASLGSHIKGNVESNFKGYLYSFAVPVVALSIIVLSTNAYEFGSPFETGYGQWVGKDTLSETWFSGVKGFLVDSQRSIFLHFPVLIFALFGARQFWKRNRFEAMLIGATSIVFLLAVAAMPFWKGEWCYGPRYLLFLLPVLSLPFVSALELLWAKKRGIAKALWGILVAVSLLYSLRLQMNVNALDFFVYYYLKNGPFTAFQSTDNKISDYFKSTHFGQINGDLLRYRCNAEPLFILEQARTHVDQETLARIKSQTDRTIALTNYYWFQ